LPPYRSTGFTFKLDNLSSPKGKITFVLRDFGIFVIGVAVGLVAAQCIASSKSTDESNARDLATDIEGRLQNLELEMH
jgi:hypothetical protein